MHLVSTILVACLRDSVMAVTSKMSVSKFKSCKRYAAFKAICSIFTLAIRGFLAGHGDIQTRKEYGNSESVANFCSKLSYSFIGGPKQQI